MTNNKIELECNEELVIPLSKYKDLQKENKNLKAKLDYVSDTCYESSLEKSKKWRPIKMKTLEQALYKDHYSLPSLKDSNLHTNGPTYYMSLTSKNIILTIPKNRSDFKTKDDLDKILKFVEEVINERA